MKKVIGFLLIMLFLIYPAQYVAANMPANMPYVRLTGDARAVVVQVIDGDALSVRLEGTNRLTLVRLAGITTMGRRDARDFMAGAVLGRTVDLLVSAADTPNERFDSRWTPVYLTFNNVVYNRALVQRGLAVIDPAYEGHWMYAALLSDTNIASTAQLGVWADEGFRTMQMPRRRVTGAGRWDERININTATSSQMNRVLFSGAGSDIVRFRNHSPFQNVGEVKFTGAFTREDFYYYWTAMKVSTNINTANEEELIQLIDVSTREARAIIRFREQRRFTSIEQLLEERLISPQAFEINRPFIAIDDVDEIIFARPNIIVDVNTASADDLQLAGLTPGQASAVVNARVNGYTLKSIGELTRMSGVGLSDRRLNEIADNIRVDAQWRNTLHTVFRPTLININTAGRNDLMRVGFSDHQISHIINRQGRMNNARDLPFDVSQFDHAITLYTNINAASREEWMSLSEDMTSAFASTLVREAMYQPFGSMDELEDFFFDNEMENVFREIRRYLVLR